MSDDADDNPDLIHLRADTLRAFAGHGPLARQEAGYRPREGQQEMAAAIAETIVGEDVLMVDAGTGIGKTFAYLVPALLSGKKVLISTATRQLQDQLFQRDLPRVRQALGLDIGISILKGRSNYVCPVHLTRNLRDGRFRDPGLPARLRIIERFAAISDTGDKAACSQLAEDDLAWQFATSTADNCLHHECPELRQCPLMKARQQAQKADVLVVNHHLFCADLALKDDAIGDFLPKAGVLIFDEAHQLPDIATDFFGEAVSTRQLLELGRESLRHGQHAAGGLADWHERARHLEHAASRLRLALPEGNLRLGMDALLSTRGDQVNEWLSDVLPDLIGTLDDHVEALKPVAAVSADLARLTERSLELLQRLQRWQRAFRRTAGMPALDDGAGQQPPSDGSNASAETISPQTMLAGEGAGPAGYTGIPQPPKHPVQAGTPHADANSPYPVGTVPHTSGQPTHTTTAAPPIAAPAQTATSVFSHIAHDLNHTGEAARAAAEKAEEILWVQTTDRHAQLRTTPLSVAERFAAQREEQGGSWIFVSATLALSDSIDHFAGQMGLFAARQLLVESPFDYERQAALWLPRQLGSPTAPGFAERVADCAWPLIRKNRGRAFVLCTTLRATRTIAERLRALADEGITILMQGDAPRHELMKRFCTLDGAVLVGSAGFWEGVDIAGDRLSLVIIDKLPFAPPDDPVHHARSRALEKLGRRAFEELSLPQAMLALKQGAGRLIRTETDRGLLVICDERLSSKGYGNRILASLPPFRRLESQGEALDFLASIHEG